MAFIRAFIGFTVAIILAAFAVFNRQIVSLNVSPWHAALDVPLYMVVLIFTAAGFMFGGIFVWLSGASVRREKRKQRKVIKSLEKELDTAVAAKDLAGAPAADLFPALPKRRG